MNICFNNICLLFILSSLINPFTFYPYLFVGNYPLTLVFFSWSLFVFFSYSIPCPCWICVTRFSTRADVGNVLQVISAYMPLELLFFAYLTWVRCLYLSSSFYICVSILCSVCYYSRLAVFQLQIYLLLQMLYIS